MALRRRVGSGSRLPSPVATTDPRTTATGAKGAWYPQPVPLQCWAWLRRPLPRHLPTRKTTQTPQSYRVWAWYPAPTNAPLHRTAWRKLLDDAAKRRFQAVLVFTLDRAFRSVRPMHDTLVVWEVQEIGFISAREGFDTRKALDRSCSTSWPASRSSNWRSCASASRPGWTAPAGGESTSRGRP